MSMKWKIVGRFIKTLDNQEADVFQILKLQVQIWLGLDYGTIQLGQIIQILKM